MAEILSLEGGLVVRLTVADGTIDRVAIANRRATQMSRLFAGRDIDETLAHIPSLFTLCGMAQASAAATAIESALGLSVEPRRRDARHALVCAEMAQEHMWRVLLDWPPSLGEPAYTGAAVAVRRLLPSLKKALDPQGNLFAAQVSAQAPELAPVQRAADRLQTLLESSDVFGAPLAEWLELDETAFEVWQQRSQSLAGRVIAWMVSSGLAAAGRVEPVFLPGLEAEALLGHMRSVDVEGFAARPTWSGQTCETTALSRNHDHHRVTSVVACHGCGLLARTVARLVELALVPAELRALVSATHTTDAASTADSSAGIGLAQIEAARGRLIHFVEVQGRRVRRYQIVAPTEWNFHPDGVLVRAVTGTSVANRQAAVETAKLLVNAIDPCVRCDVEVAEAA